MSSTLDQGHFQQLSIGSTPPSYATTAAVTIEVNSAYSDYFYLVDSAAQKSSYIIGSRAGGLADGLNIWDASAGTMIASFSKQSVRFFQSIVGPVFDTGGDYYNAATFVGSGSSLSGVQAAINQASIDGKARVLVPASMYPYDASRISFIYPVQMVREGGKWDVYDIQAYGADVTGNSASSISNRASVQETLNAAAGQGTAFVSSGTCVIRHGLRLPSETEFVGEGWRSILHFNYVASGSSNYLQNANYPSANTNIRLRSFQIRGGGTGIRTAGVSKPAGVVLRSVHSYFVSDLRVTLSPAIAIAHQACRGGRIVNNVIENCEADGITSFFSTQDCVIANNTIIAVGDDGIGVVAGSSGVTGIPNNIVIVGNTIFGNSVFTSPAAGRGIALIGARDVIVANNAIESTAAEGIRVSCEDGDVTQRGQRITVIGNRVHSAGSAGPTGGQATVGLSLLSVDNVLVVGNMISAASSNGILIQSVRDAVIKSNSIVSCGHAVTTSLMAIDVSISASSRLAILGNLIQGNAAGGIAWRNAGDGLIAHNMIVDNGANGDGTNNAAAGIYGENMGTVASTLIIRDNHITDSRAAGSKLQSYGVRLAGGQSLSTVVIADNYLSGNSGAGINLSGGAPISLTQHGNVGHDSSQPNTYGWWSPSAFTVGSAVTPGMSFSSEVSLGWYRSAASHMALSYGTLDLSGGVRVLATANSATLPQHRFYAGSGQHLEFALGRSSNELYLRVPNSAGGFFATTRVGDAIIGGNSATTMHLGVGSGNPQLSLTSRAGRNFVNFNQSGIISIRTIATSLDSSTMTAGEFAFTILASGATLALHSGSTIYFFTSSASTVG